jgi:hypothetical protein
MVTTVQLLLVAVFVFSAVAGFNKWLEHIEQRRVVLTWPRIFLSLWAVACGAWIGPLIFLSIVHGDFVNSPVRAVLIIAELGIAPAVLILFMGLAITRAWRNARRAISLPVEEG